MGDNQLARIGPLVDTICAGALFFNTIVTKNAMPGNHPLYLEGRVADFVHCFMRGDLYSTDGTIGTQCPYEAKTTPFAQLAAIAGSNGSLSLGVWATSANAVIAANMRSWLVVVRRIFEKFAANQPMVAADFGKLNSIYNLAGLGLARPRRFPGADPFVIDDQRPDLANLVDACNSVAGWKKFYDNSRIQGVIGLAVSTQQVAAGDLESAYVFILWKEIAIAIAAFMGIIYVKMDSYLPIYGILSHYISSEGTNWSSRLQRNLSATRGNIWTKRCLDILARIKNANFENPNVIAYMMSTIANEVSPDKNSAEALLTGLSADFQAYMESSSADRTANFFKSIEKKGSMYTPRADDRIMSYLTDGLVDDETYEFSLDFTRFIKREVYQPQLANPVDLQNAGTIKQTEYGIRYLNKLCDIYKSLLFIVARSVLADPNKERWTVEALNVAKKLLKVGTNDIYFFGQQVDAWHLSETRIPSEIRSVYFYAENYIYKQIAEINDSAAEHQTTDGWVLGDIINTSTLQIDAEFYLSLFGENYDCATQVFEFCTKLDARNIDENLVINLWATITSEQYRNALDFNNSIRAVIQRQAALAAAAAAQPIGVQQQVPPLIPEKVEPGDEPMPHAAEPAIANQPGAVSPVAAAAAAANEPMQVEQLQVIVPEAVSKPEPMEAEQVHANEQQVEAQVLPAIAIAPQAAIAAAPMPMQQLQPIVPEMGAVKIEPQRPVAPGIAVKQEPQGQLVEDPHPKYPSLVAQAQQQQLQPIVPEMGAVKLEFQQQQQSLPPRVEMQTHTAAAEAVMVNAKDTFRVVTGEGFKRYYRERPADQLATAMLGTACKGPRKAPGCYEIPDGPNQTNLPCANPADAVTGKCNFKTIPVPWENPVGNSQIYRVYQSLDVGAQIKLQLQRALIRYGYAAATLPLYCNRVLDRHFAMLVYNPIADPANPQKPFGNLFDIIQNAVDLAKDPAVSMWTRQQLASFQGAVVEPAVSTNHNVASFPLNVDPRNIGMGYAKFATTDFSGDEIGASWETQKVQYLKRNLLPHYSRILPRDSMHIPRDLAAALVDGIPPGTGGVADPGADIQGKRNTFYPYATPGPGVPLPAGGYVPFPIWYAPNGTLPPAPNKAYLNEKYIGPENEGKRMLMMHRGSGMLLRAMQHLRNAMVLYVLAATHPISSAARWAPETYETAMQKLGEQQHDLLTVLSAERTEVPKGALAFLTAADKDAMVALFKGLLTTPYMAGGKSQFGGVQVFDQITDERDMRISVDGRSMLAVGTPYKFDHIPQDIADPGDRANREQWINFNVVYRRVVYLEVLWSYWYDNNSMGRLRKRMNFRAKLARPDIAISAAGQDLQTVVAVGQNYQLAADVLQPYGWKDATLQGLVIMHVRAIKEAELRQQPMQQ